MTPLRLLFLGDIVGRPGRRAVQALLPQLRARFQPHVVVANAENAAGGKGITPAVYEELRDMGIDVLTLGNHVYDQKDLLPAVDHLDRLVIPANLPPEAPGQRWVALDVENQTLVILNLLGRLFTGLYDNPFHTLDRLLEKIPEHAHVLVDFHAETTSEKLAFALDADGRVSAVVGTHTHVQTSDARILPRGAAYITDAGMCGGLDGVIGIRREEAIRRFRTGLPQPFTVEDRRPGVEGVFLTLGDPRRALAVEAFRMEVPAS